MPRLGSVDARFLSYNIEMVEITGGPFWRPYRPARTSTRSQSAKPESSGANLFEDRTPIDLTNARLRVLAAALGPAYLRVSGRWANTTYFADSGRLPAPLPRGFTGVLTGAQWRHVVAFSQFADAPIVTSFAAGRGNRDAAGVWRPEQAERLLGFTRAIGGKLAGVEFINEPDLAAIGGLPRTYDAAAYGRDFKLFHSLIRRATPGTMILGPATIGETARAADLLAATAGDLDAVSYHYYPILSQRCGVRTAPEATLSERWLSGADRALAFYRNLRDRLAHAKPIWVTETADAACGGNPWGATFLDTFRYLDQLGRLARDGVRVVMHNTLVGSDYGLLDETTFAPRPDYWGALLWRRMMGPTVLDPGVPGGGGLHLYAHCLRRSRGGVALLAINADRRVAHAIEVPTAAVRYTLDAASLFGRKVRLNGRALRMTAGSRLPSMAGAPAGAGTVKFAPATITFLAMADAGNPACQ
ncbi:MAG: hypothetical protein ACRECL_13380 [Bradyrhizobium sp.]